MTILSEIKKLFTHDQVTRKRLDYLSWRLNDIEERVHRQTLNEFRKLVMSSTEKGVTIDRICGSEIIVSLTSYGNRIYDVCLAIESIMQGTLKPNRIILWLSKDEFLEQSIPITLQKQQNRGLEIEFCKDIKSYKKIIPVMTKFPDACIITIDDDLIYNYDLVERLVSAHISNPQDICACRMHRIKVDGQNRPLSYLQWDMLVSPLQYSPLLFLTTGGGTLFPPHCFQDEFFNEDRFMSLCPYADDVWVNAMILMFHKKIAKAATYSKDGCDYQEINLLDLESLSIENNNPQKCRNDVQIKAVFDYYDLYKYLGS